MSQRNCVFVTQELGCETGIVFIHVRIKLLVILLCPLILFLGQRQLVLYVVTCSVVSFYDLYVLLTNGQTLGYFN